MYLKRLNSVRRKLWCRIAVWYVVIFAISMLGTFVSIYYVVNNLQDERINQALLNEVKEYSALFRLKGIDEVQTEIVLEAESEGQEKVFFRLLTFKGEVIGGSSMSDWQAMGISPTPFQRAGNTKNHLFETLVDSEHRKQARILSAVIGPDTILQMGVSIRDDKRFMAAFSKIFMGTMIIFVLLAAGIGGIISKLILSGIGQVTSTAHEISQGSIEQRVIVKTKVDEIERLAQTFNNMLDRIQGLVAGMIEVTDNIAHDLKTPITRIRNIAESDLVNGGHACGNDALAVNTLDECDRLLEMINTILDISEAEAGATLLDRKPIDISAIIEDVADLYHYVAEEKKIHLSYKSTDRLVVKADPVWLRRAVANLVDNAIKYSPTGQQVAIEAFAHNGEVNISVKDNGIGIPKDDLPRIWDRLFRGDQSRSEKGFGLGLSLVKAVIQSHRGRVTVHSEPGQGSVFTIHLPAHN